VRKMAGDLGAGGERTAAQRLFAMRAHAGKTILFAGTVVVRSGRAVAAWVDRARGSPGRGPKCGDGAVQLAADGRAGGGRAVLAGAAVFFVEGSQGGWCRAVLRNCRAAGKVPAELRAAVADKQVVWVHAVSVGEVLAATRLVAELEAALDAKWGEGGALSSLRRRRRGRR
jgi:hypothetical protein